jgi:hypothetical protein
VPEQWLSDDTARLKTSGAPFFRFRGVLDPSERRHRAEKTHEKRPDNL